MTVSFSSNYTKYATNCRTAVELKGHEYCNALLDNEQSHFKTPCCPLWINTLAVALTDMLCVSCSNIIVFLFTARCTLVQSAVLPSHVVCLTVRPSVCNVGGLWSHRLEFCRGGPAPDRLSAALISRKFVVARACVRGPRQQADVSAAGW